MKSFVLACALLAIGCVRPACCGIWLEGFDNLSLLGGSGWMLKNNSSPAGSTSWFQGYASVFAAESGAADSYAGANFNNTGDHGVISNWMITPEFIFINGDSLTFATRTVSSPMFPDRLEVRFSAAGGSSDVGSTGSSVGDFTTLLLTINPTLSTSGYPSVWSEYTVSLTGLPGNTGGRLAFRYFVPDAGLLGTNSDYIGIDSVRLDVASVPEPMTMVLAGAGLIALSACRRRRRL